MRAIVLVIAALLVSACGGSSSNSVTPTPVPSPSPTPTPAPSPAPTPTRFTFSGRIIETLTGTPIANATVAATGASVQSDASGSFSFDSTTSSTARVTVTAAGYLVRETTITAGRVTSVDLIRNSAPFSLEFFRQLARNTWESGSADVLRMLPSAPSFYLQTSGLSSSNARDLETAARAIVPAFTGGKFTVTTFETGSEARPERTGWIVIELVDESNVGTQCGRAYVGATTGHIWLQTGSRCKVDGGRNIDDAVLSHEIGHALGFWHLDFQNALMHPSYETAHKQITDGEKYHGSVAYTRFAGNRDIDVDADNTGPRRASDDRVLIVD
jgi:hypothetical protein